MQNLLPSREQLVKVDQLIGKGFELSKSGAKAVTKGSFLGLSWAYHTFKPKHHASVQKRDKTGKFVSSKRFQKLGNFDFSYFKEKSSKKHLEVFSPKVLENILNNAGVSGFKNMSVKDAPSFITYIVALKEGVVPSKVKEPMFELEDERTVEIQKPRYNHIINAYTFHVVVSRRTQELVALESMLTSKAFWETKGDLVLPIGKSEKGYVFTDLAKLPHLLVAGTTGSGKSTAVDAMLVGLMHRVPAQDLKLLLIDPKRVAFNVYKGIEGVAVVTEMEEALGALQAIVTLMEKRYETFEEEQVKDLKEYNALVCEPMERYVIVVDELADLMSTNGEEVSLALGRLAQKSRAAGIHLVLATQRPTTSVIKGNIKANIVARLGFQLKTATDSLTILGEGGAEKLNGQGDGYFSEGGKKVRLKSPFIENSNIKKIIGD